jgi:hypothetical protein
MKKLFFLLALCPAAWAADNQLLWDEPADLTQIVTYQIERAVLPAGGNCDNASGWEWAAEVPVGTQGWLDAGRAEGSLYCYRAFSANPDQGRSPPSNVAGRYIPFSLAPTAAPVNLRVTAPGN